MRVRQGLAAAFTTCQMDLGVMLSPQILSSRLTRRKIAPALMPAAVVAVARVNMPSYFHTHAMRTAALGQLGRREEARNALQDLLALHPYFAAAARQEYGKWYDSELIEQLIEGLRKAGLEIPANQKRIPSGPDSLLVRNTR
jgi:hypothetical protein